MYAREIVLVLFRVCFFLKCKDLPGAHPIPRCTRIGHWNHSTVDLTLTSQRHGMSPRWLAKRPPSPVEYGIWAIVR